MLTRQTFGQMIALARQAKRWSTTVTVRAVGLFGDPPRAMSEQTLLRIENDERRHHDPAMVARLIEVLELPPREAWEAAYPEVVAAVLELVAGDPAPGAAAGRAQQVKPTLFARQQIDTCNDKSRTAGQRLAALPAAEAA